MSERKRNENGAQVWKKALHWLGQADTQAYFYLLALNDQIKFKATNSIIGWNIKKECPACQQNPISLEPPPKREASCRITKACR